MHPITAVRHSPYIEVGRWIEQASERDSENQFYRFYASPAQYSHDHADYIAFNVTKSGVLKDIENERESERAGKKESVCMIIGKIRGINEVHFTQEWAQFCQIIILLNCKNAKIFGIENEWAAMSWLCCMCRAI